MNQPVMTFGYTMKLGLSLLTVLTFQSFMFAVFAADTGESPYFDSLQVERNENWLRRQVREFRAYPHLDKAYRLIEQNDPAQARVELERYLDIDPADLRAHYTYLNILYQLKDHAAVVQHATAVIGRQPDFVPAYLYRGLSYQALGQNDQAIDDFKAALQVERIEEIDRLFALKSLVHLYIAESRREEAIQTLDSILGIQDEFESWFQRGVLLDALRRWNEAFDSFSRCLSFSLTDEERDKTVDYLIELAKKSKQLDVAVGLLQGKLLEDPDNVNILRSLANLTYENGSFDESIRWIRRAIEIEPVAGHQEFLANLLYLKKDYQAAADLFSRLLSVYTEPSDLDRVSRSLSTVLEQQGRFAEAMQALQSAPPSTERDDERQAAIFHLIEMAIQAGQLDQALEGLELSEESVKQNPALCRLLRNAYAQSKQYEKAIQWQTVYPIWNGPPTTSTVWLIYIWKTGTMKAPLWNITG